MRASVPLLSLLVATIAVAACGPDDKPTGAPARCGPVQSATPLDFQPNDVFVTSTNTGGVKSFELVATQTASTATARVLTLHARGLDARYINTSCLSGSALTGSFTAGSGTGGTLVLTTAQIVVSHVEPSFLATGSLAAAWLVGSGGRLSVARDIPFTGYVGPP